MKKKILIFLIFIQANMLFAHGFGAHAAHHQKLVELNLPGSYLSIINDDRYKPYFIYGSIFPDIQYTAYFKEGLNSLYDEVASTDGITGITYKIGTNDIPDNVDYVFGINTHHDKYAMQFAEYLFTQSGLSDPPGPDPGGTNTADSKNRKIAFALGYYAHLSEDIVAHDFLVPRITAELNLGDIELIKGSDSFAEDPNAQTEGIIEGIVDHFYGNNNLISQTVYSDIWVAWDQAEPSLAQLNPLVWTYNGELYDPQEYQSTYNPVLEFFHEVLTDWYNNNPFNLPADYKESNAPMSKSGLREIATIFRFVNRFYPSIAGHPYNGFDRLDEVLANWVSTHLNYSPGVDVILVLTDFMQAISEVFDIRRHLFEQLAYPGALSSANRSLAEDARTLVTLMLADMDEADALVDTEPELVNISEYNKLKNSLLFTNPTSILDPIWNDYLTLGCKIYSEIGPGGATPKWYSDWSPWHSQSMTWGAMSSLNNLLSGIYSSNPDVAIYSASFEIGGNEVTGPISPSVFQSNSTAKINLELYNTKNVASQNIKLQVKKDHNSVAYTSDQMITNTTFSIDHNPENYGSVSRLNKELTFNVSVADLNDNVGYYFELVNPITNKATFTSSFEQYLEQLNLTPNYAHLYNTYSKWPVSLGVTQNIATISTISPQLTEESSTGGHYLINGIESSSIQIAVNSYFNIEAIPPSDEYSFYKWSDGNTENPRNYRSTESTTISAEFKKLQASDDYAAYNSGSQRKFIKVPYTNYLVSTYESMDRIWLEGSTNNGITWSILNDGQPINGNTVAKNPSLGVVGDCRFAVVHQENSSGNKIKIKVIEICGPSTIVEFDGVVDAIDGNYDANPVVAIQDVASNSSNLYLIVWDENYVNSFSDPGLHYRILERNSSGNFNFLSSPGKISNTDASSLNPSLAADFRVTSSPESHLAWQQDVNISTKKIKYYKLKMNYSNNTLDQLDYYEPSSGSGFSNNYNPSITVVNNGTPRLSWIGYRITDVLEKIGKNSNLEAQGTSETRAILRYRAVSGVWYGTFYKLGSEVYNVNIAYVDNYSRKYIMGWSSGSGSSFTNSYIKGYTSPIYSFGTTGKYLQVSNSYDVNTLWGNSFQNSTAPYSFTTSYNGSPQKTNTLPNNVGREGVVRKGDVQFYFTFGDITVDNETIDFAEFKDSLRINNLNKLNRNLITKPFEINSKSTLTFSVSYGITDSLFTENEFEIDESVNFHVELVDSKTNNVIGVYSDVTYNKSHLEPSKSIAYEIDSEGIGEKTVELRLVVEDKMKDTKYSLAELHSNERILGKSNYKKVTFNGELKINNYSLSQNYPNPFNPQTTISYQLPNDGIVTLKVYDILGKEITVLVNEYKTSGRYNIIFDGSNLASGIYFYTITVGAFKDTKKLILIK